MTTPKNDKNTRTTGRPTLNEVARLAGVSPITASRALRGVSTVATELVEKVQKAALELNYVVNPAARALASAQSHSVVVLVPSLSNLLFIDTLEAIHRVLTPKGFEVLIGNFHYSRDEEENLLRNYMAYQPRGFLLTGFDRTESSRRMIEASNIPCVYMMELDSAAGLNCVGFSQLSAGETAAEHLLSRGRKRLAYIGAQLDQRTLLRGEGFRKALQKAGRYDPDLEVLTPRSSSRGPGWRAVPATAGGASGCRCDLLRQRRPGAGRASGSAAPRDQNSRTGGDSRLQRLADVRTHGAAPEQHQHPA
jgi:LacI family gluconate utilization system Gnt-I transcriptional repressor